MCSSPSVGRSVLGTIAPSVMLAGVHVCPNDLTTIIRRRSGAHQVPLSTAMSPVTAHDSDCSKKTTPAGNNAEGTRMPHKHGHHDVHSPGDSSW